MRNLALQICRMQHCRLRKDLRVPYVNFQGFEKPEQSSCCRLEEDLRSANTAEERFSLNWIKLQLWRWEEYDALVVLDADVLVRGDLTHLATDFAWTRNNGPFGWEVNKVRARPCAGVSLSLLGGGSALLEGTFSALCIPGACPPRPEQGVHNLPYPTCIEYKAN